MRLSAAAALREEIDARKHKMSATWAEPDVRFGRYTGDAALDPRAPVVVVEHAVVDKRPHGVSRYTNEPCCRCAVCKKAMSDYQHARWIKAAPKRRKKAALEVKPSKIKGRPADPTCKHSGNMEHSWYPCGSGMMRCRYCLKAESEARQPGLFPQPKRSNVLAMRPVEAAEALGGAPVPDVCEAGQAFFNGEDL